jgi:hypothetical protein
LRSHASIVHTRPGSSTARQAPPTSRSTSRVQGLNA